MKKYIKQGLDTLEALDCRLDHKDRELRTDRWRFTHPNAPDEFFTLGIRSSEPAVRAVVQRARVAAGLATSESREGRKPRASARQKAERAAERRQIEAARLAADARVAEREASRLVEARRRQVQQLDRMLRGRVDIAAEPIAVAPDAMLTVEEVADMTGLTDRAVQHAVASGSLEAYRCGKRVKVRGSDVRAWMGGAP